MKIFNADMTINKNLVKFAKALNLEVCFDADDSMITVSEIDEDGEAFCEWLYSYKVEGGELFYRGNVYFPEKEELPNWINSGAKFKELMTFTAKTMAE